MLVLWERLRAIFLADAPADLSLQRLHTSFSAMDGVRKLKAHKWRKRDLQYCVTLPILLYAYIICESPSFIPRTLFVLFYIYLCLAPVFSQFFLPFLPTATYLILFYVCRFINPVYRPPIFVRVLPGLETIFYGGDLSATLSASTNSVLDIIAWIPYGLGHFGAPFVVSLIMFLFGPPKMLPTFHFAFGYMNIIGVSTQILFPNAPPWYRLLYGLKKANYGMKGNPGGLSRIDKLLHANLYTSGFGNSPMVFGAFPSLHSADAVMEALFLAYVFPSSAPFVAGYVLWIWYATMYLTHHYFADLIGGGVLSLFVFYACRCTIMPQVERGKFGRWSYSKLKIGLPYDFSSSTGSREDGYNLYNEEALADPISEDHTYELNSYV